MTQAEWAKALEATNQKVLQLEKKIQRHDDVEEIRALVHKYGYYMDKHLYKEILSLFSKSDGTKVYCHGGIWTGKTASERFYGNYLTRMFTDGKNGPAFGWLCDHLMMQDIIDVDEDGKTAKSRSRLLMVVASHDDAVKDDPNPLSRDSCFRSWWEGALYENQFVKVDGCWKIHVLKYRPQWHSQFGRGPSETPADWVPFVKGPKYPEDPAGPDIIEEAGPDTIWLWPDTHVEPFHYPDLAGNWLTDKDRLGTRRQLKIYPKKADAYEMQQRAEIAAAKTNGFPNGNHK